LRVPEDYTLGDLHGILQIAFGWENDHMHSFTVNSVEYGMSEIESMGFADEYKMAGEDTVCLSHLHLQPKQKFTYLYDFGDSWVHEITVSKIIPIGAEDEDLMLPRCLEGERAGPPEDCGGIWGYERMLEILKDPNHEEYGDFEWAKDIDPEYIDLEEINECLEETVKPRFKNQKSKIKSQKSKVKSQKSKELKRCLNPKRQKGQEGPSARKIKICCAP
jgi:hypothetical protein